MSKTGVIIDEHQQYSSETSDRKVSTRKTDQFTLRQSVQNAIIKYLQELSKCFSNRYLKTGKRLNNQGIEDELLKCQVIDPLLQNRKRPVPDQVKKLIGQKKQASFCSIKQIKQDGAKLVVEIQLNHQIVNSYNYYQKLHNEVKEETI